MLLRAFNSALAGHVGGVARREIRAKDGVYPETRESTWGCCGYLCPVLPFPSPLGVILTRVLLGALCRAGFLRAPAEQTCWLLG